MKAFCAMDAIHKKIVLIESSEPVKHLRNAKKEVLLAIRALIDTAINKIEKAEEKSKFSYAETEE